MISKGRTAFATVVLIVFLFSACATPGSHGVPPPPPKAIHEAEQSIPPASPARPAQPKAPEKPKPAVANEKPRKPIKVSKEVYKRTFHEVEKVIDELNSIISNGDFELWKSFLTPAYRREMSKPETLAKLSKSPILESNNIVLKSLEDYFHWVVVPSRSDVRLDDLRFLNENTVEAIMIVGNQQIILYRLEKRNGSWKIALL